MKILIGKSAFVLLWWIMRIFPLLYNWKSLIVFNKLIIDLKGLHLRKWYPHHQPPTTLSFSLWCQNKFLYDSLIYCVILNFQSILTTHFQVFGKILVPPKLYIVYADLTKSILCLYLVSLFLFPLWVRMGPNFAIRIWTLFLSMSPHKTIKPLTVNLSAISIAFILLGRTNHLNYWTPVPNSSNPTRFTYFVNLS